MLKKHFFWPMLLALLFFSSQWLQAAIGDKTDCTQLWKGAQLNSIVNDTFVKQTTIDNVQPIQITIGAGKDGTKLIFDEGTDDRYNLLSADEPRIQFGKRLGAFDSGNADISKGSKDFLISWAPVNNGYSVVMKSVSLRLRSYAVGGVESAYCTLGKESEKNVTAGYDWDEGTVVATTKIDETATSLPFILRRREKTKYIFTLNRMEYVFNIIPNAPTWNLLDNKDKMTVSINNDYWYEVANHVVTNDAFEGTIKYELDPEAASSKYVIWNSDSTKFKVLKEGTYRVRAYIDMAKGKYCSSAYGEYLEITASIAESERESYHISFMVDGQLATENDPVNHFWDITIPVTQYGEHYIEYVSAQSTPTLEFPTRTQDYLTYQPEVVTDPFGDHFKIFGEEGTDTVVVKQGEKAVATLRIHITREGTNHVPFIINTKEQYDNKSLLTAINDCSWNGEKDHFDIEFNAKENSERRKHRSFEVTFTGIPDTMTFTYGSLATAIAAQSQLLVQIYDGTWKELTQISSKYGGTNNDYKFALAPNVSKVKFDYWNVENIGWIKDLKITERKDIVFPQDTLLLWGRHKQGGTATQRYDIAWYNLHPDLTLTIANDTYSRFTKNFAGGNTVSLDGYGTLPVDITYALDSVGVVVADLMAQSGGVHNSIVRGCILKGVTGYGEDELVLENTLPEDTISGTKDTPIDNPFHVTDTLGQEITNDSLHIEYEITPAEGVIIDENGKFVPKCVGYTQIVAKAEENMIIPGGLKDTLYIYLDEEETNVITWDSAKFDIGIGDNVNFSNFAHSADQDAVLTINEISDTKLLTRTNGNSFHAGDQTGFVTLEAIAGKTCNHFEVRDTFTFMLKGVIEKPGLDSAAIRWKDVQVGDTLTNILVVKDSKGNILTPPAIDVIYSVMPREAATALEDGRLVILETAGNITITATVTGDSIKTLTSSYTIEVKPTQETIYWENVPDTMVIDSTYNMYDLVLTRSKSHIDTLFVAPEETEKVSIVLTPAEDMSVTPLTTGVVAVWVRSQGTKDYTGPKAESKTITFVKNVKPIEWPNPDDENPQIYVGDTLKGFNPDSIAVVDQYGDTIENPIITYTIEPEGAAHFDSISGEIIVDSVAQPLIIHATVEGQEGDSIITTHQDIVIDNIQPYDNVEVNWGDIDLSDIHNGDTIRKEDLGLTFGDGRELPEDLVEVVLSTEPEDVSHLDEEGNLVIDKTGEDVKIIVTVTGAGVEDGEIQLDTTVTFLRKYDLIDLAQAGIPTSLAKDSTFTLTYLTTANGQTIEYKTADASIIDVQGTALVGIAEEGEVKIMLATAGNDEFLPDTTYATVTAFVTQQQDLVTWTSDSIVIVKGEEIQNILSYVSAAHNQIDTVYSGDIAIATVDGTIVSGIEVGVTTLTAATAGDKYYATASATTKVSVVMGVQDLDTPSEEDLKNITIGDTLPAFPAQVFDAEGNDITDQVEKTYEFIPDDFAHIDPETGEIVIDKAGEGEIIVTISGEGIETKTDTVKLDVNKQKDPLPENLATLIPDSMAVGTQIPMPTHTANGQEIIYESSDPSIISFENGNLVCKGEGGPVTITAKTNGTDELAGETFSKETNTFKSALLEDYIDLSNIPEVMYVGHTVQLPEFSAYGNAKIIYSVDSTAMDLNGLTMTCIINEAKVITLAAHTEIGDEYNAAYASKTIQVLVDDIDMSALPDTMYIGQKVTLPLQSLAGYDVTYTSNNPTILSVEGNVVTCLAATHLVVTIQGETPMVYGVQTLKKKVVYTRDNGCVDAIKQVWEDVLAIDNSGVDTVFVSYQWFKDGEELTGETRQYLQNVNGLDGSYTVEMKDANGKVYHACEFYLEPKSERAPMMVVYPTIVPANGQYTVETSNEGELTVISREGINADKQTLDEGKNAIVAPMQSGVYILRYETRDGEVATGKLIVK